MTNLKTNFFGDLAPLAFNPTAKANDTAFLHYNSTETLGDKTLAEHLRFAACYWHSFCWPGGDPFGGQTFERPWFETASTDPIEQAKLKADVAFDFFKILGVPYFCFHDADVRPEGDSFAETAMNLEIITDYFVEKMDASGMKLLWGTANLFSHRRYMSGAATNPDPEIFAYAAATVKTCMDATLKLGGENYVLWGGREGYETLLNTDLKREDQQLGRFLNMVVDYKHKIGFEGAILIEPKPQEPTKHQYDYDVTTVYGFLKRHGLENEVKVNIEQGHAILAGHSFEHEIATANALGIFGSIDMNRNDYQAGWDTDQFPNNVPEVALAYYHILQGGGFTAGGTNFDAKLRRQSLDPIDLVMAHAGAMDICARGIKAAYAMIEEGLLSGAVDQRYVGWNKPENAQMLTTDSLGGIHARVSQAAPNPQPISGQQERLENLVNRYV